jgi:hypothetical protein
MLVGLTSLADCWTGGVRVSLGTAAVVRVGWGEEVATWVIGGGGSLVATFGCEQAATDNNEIAVIPVMNRFAWFIGLASINTFGSETGNPL